MTLRKSLSLVVVLAVACNTDRYGDASSSATTTGVDAAIATDATPTATTGDDNDFDETIDGEVVCPGGACLYTDEPSDCVDQEALAKLRERKKALDAAIAKRLEKAKELSDAVGKLFEAADIKHAFAGKFPVVVRKGAASDTIKGVPEDIRKRFKDAFGEAAKDTNGGWFYDETASNAEGAAFLTQAELDRLVDATAKGAGALIGMEAYKLDGTPPRYAVVQNNRVLIYVKSDELSNPRTVHQTPDGTITWPDDYARYDPVAKWFTAAENRWTAYVARGSAIVGTDPAKTRDELIKAAIQRALDDLFANANPFNWETAYEIIKVLPVTGTIDAIQRGDCVDAVSSALFDLATLVGFFPAKVFQIGKLGVRGVVLAMALDGAAITVRIAYKKDGAWVEAIVVGVLQIRVLKKALKGLLATQRARAAAAGIALAALSLACDKVDAALDAATAAEDEVGTALDAYDKARAELMNSYKIPCSTDGVPVGTDDTTELVVAATYGGTLTDAVSHVVELAPVDPTSADAALVDLRAALQAPTLLQLKSPTAVAAKTTQPTAPPPTTTTTTTTTCPQPVGGPSVADLVARYQKALDTIEKIRRITKERRAAIDDALIVSLTLTLAELYGLDAAEIRRLTDEFMAYAVKRMKSDGIPYDGDVDRTTRLNYLLMLANKAIAGKPLANGTTIKATDPAKATLIARLRTYLADNRKNGQTGDENETWFFKNSAKRFYFVINAIQKIEAAVKACKPIDWASLGYLSGPTTMTADEFVAWLKEIEAELAKIEPKIDKAAKVILGP